MPIYIVSPGNRLIRANTYGQAVNYAAKAMFKAVPVKSDTLADLLAQGVKIEDARAPVNQELPLENGIVVPPAGGPSVGTVTKCDGNHGGPMCSDPECWHGAEPGPDPLPATGGPLEPGIDGTEMMARAYRDAAIIDGTATADDIDTVNLEGIDHVQ
jgi:hypothetical protein